MITFKIKEEYDGRLPSYNVIKVTDEQEELVKTFDTYKEAEIYINMLIRDNKITPCGEEDPCS